MNLNLFRRGRIWPALVVFLVASLLLCLLWLKVGHTYEILMAGPVAHIAVAVSPDITWSTRDESGEAVVVLANNQRWPVVQKAIGMMAMYSYPVFFSLLLAGLCFPGMRRFMMTPPGIARVGIGIAVLVAYHLLLSAVFFCRLGAHHNRQMIPGGLKFLGALGDITQMFVPFALFAILFIWWAPRTNGMQPKPSRSKGSRA